MDFYHVQLANIKVLCNEMTPELCLDRLYQTTDPERLEVSFPVVFPVFCESLEA